MMLMPIVLMVISSSVPGGVNLYWAVSNICSIVQQVVTLRILQAQEASAKRKVRK
jgi:YidC/Oxa1 family membrane protein insertase